MEIGETRNRLTLIAPSENKNKAIFKCTCGNIKEINKYNVSSSHIRSCGCLREEVRRSAKTTHGHCKKRAVSPEYQSWQSMRNRCNVPNNKSYKDYGGRGITVCERWENSFENFFSDMGSRPSIKHSLDRINVNGNYEPENCRWATKTTQARNTRRNHYITYNGETKCLAEWCEILGLSKPTIELRILRRKWSVEKAFNTPNIKQNPKVSKATIKKIMALEGKMSKRKIAKKFGVSNTWVNKLHSGEARPASR